jgi:ATP-dependent DNA helicase Q1
VESLLIHLLLSKHFREDFQTTAYNVNVYIIPGSQALRLSRLSRTDVEGGKCPKIEHSFLKKTGKRKSLSKPKTGGKRGKQTTLDLVQGDDDDGSETQQTPFQRVSTTRMQSQHGSKAATRTTKRKRIMSSDGEKGSVPDSSDDITQFIVDDDVDDLRVGGSFVADEYTSSSAQDEWTYSLTVPHSRGNRPLKKRRRLAQPNVIEISD